MSDKRTARVAGFIFTVVIPSVLALMIPHISLGVGLPLILVSVVIGLADLAWSYSPLPGRKKMWPIFAMTVGLLVFGGGVIWFVLAHSLHAPTQPHPAGTLAEGGAGVIGPAVATQITLATLFETDFPEYIKLSGGERIRLVPTKGGPEVNVVAGIIVHLDIAAKMKFYSVFVPDGAGTVPVCDFLSRNFKSMMSHWEGRITAKGRYFADSTPTAVSDLVPTGIVYVYVEDGLTPEQVGELTRRFRTEQNIDVRFRGPEYVSARELQARAH